jgi:hypothetical protein
MVHAQHFTEGRVAETTVGCGREHFESGECTQQTLKCGWVRAGIRGEFGDGFGAGSKQVSDA